MKNGLYNDFSFSASEERINKLINSLRVGILLQGPQAELLFSNKAALEILGAKKEELNGAPFFSPGWDVIHEDGSSFSELCYPVSTALRTKKTVNNIIMGVSKPGSDKRVWLQVNADPVLNEEGNVKEVLCCFNDITERKSSEEKFTWLYQSLEARAYELAISNAELERFAYVTTHDLQEPLRMVSSFTQLLKKKYEKQLDEKAGEYINYAVEGANRMKKLLQDLLEYSRVSSNREEFLLTEMNAILNNVQQKLSNELNGTKAELIISSLPAIKVNPALMEQVFENLISNSLKYRSQSFPVIQISCQEETDKYIFIVKDNGIGIDPRYADKVFVLFQRLHNQNETYDGTGAGLAICKKIVELHRGSIWLVSEVEKGSTFYFTIPKTDCHEKL